jgi:adenylate cyclase class 2
MFEVELKSRCHDVVRIKQNLAGSGFSFTQEIEEHDLYFNHPQRNFISTDEAIRLRRSGDSCILTYKGPRNPGIFKTREEIESVADFEGMRTILVRCGFVESGQVIKKRELYSLNHITACIDDVRGLGHFVELEIITDDRNHAENELLGIARQVGLSEFIQTSYLTMLHNSRQ